MLNTTSERSRLLARLHDARAETDALFALVKPEFIMERPVAERHRMMFYIGHLEAFDWNLLAPKLELPNPREELDRLFAFGIDPVDGELPSDRPSDWPPIETFFRYRDQVREELDAALRESKHTRIDALLNVVVEHRYMHAETLSYLLHQLPLQMKQGTSALSANPSRRVTPEKVRIPAGKATLGLRSDSGEFGWDNEFEQHTVDIPAFTIDKYKVSNGQFLAFLNDDGYTRRELWTDEDWSWKEKSSLQHPAFWVRGGNGWLWKSMFDFVPLPLDWPVYASQAEASAFAKWSHRKLPTEAQWQRAAFGDSQSVPRIEEWDAKPRFDPLPVDSKKLIAPFAYDVVGLRGNGWEWTSTVFAPFHGFQIRDFYPGYSQPFFDGKHFVLKGGSTRTAPSMLRPSFRNWFQAHYPFVYAGFRCVDV
jgi:ergothioneine biosynthesis protein EgtB